MVKFLQLGQSALIALTSQNTVESFNVTMEPGNPTACSADSAGLIGTACHCFMFLEDAFTETYLL